MKNLGITSGVWIFGKTSVYSSSNVEGNIICNSPVEYHKSMKNWKANAKLIADAGTTANKCGLLPSELLEQRDSLSEALQHTLEIMYHCDAPKELFATYSNALSNYNNLLKDIKNDNPTT